MGDSWKGGLVGLGVALACWGLSLLSPTVGFIMIFLWPTSLLGLFIMDSPPGMTILKTIVLLLMYGGNFILYAILFNLVSGGKSDLTIFPKDEPPRSDL